MGLDLLVFSRLKEVQSPNLDASGSPVAGDDELEVLAEDVDQGLAAGVEVGKVYSYAELKQIRIGSYFFYFVCKSTGARYVFSNLVSKPFF